MWQDTEVEILRPHTARAQDDRAQWVAAAWLSGGVKSVKAAAELPHSKSVKGGAKFWDASADGFCGEGEVESGGFVEEEDYAVEFAIADAAGEGEADGMEEIAAAEAAGFF